MMNEDGKERPDKTLSDISRKTLDGLERTWERLIGLTRLKVTGKLDPDLSETDEQHVREKMRTCIFGRGGDMASRSESVELGRIYLKLSPQGRKKFALILARDFDVDRERVDSIRDKIGKLTDENRKVRAEIELSEAMVAPRVKLLKQFNSLPQGFKFLIDFRAELLAIKKQDPHLSKLDADLKNILSSWFDVGFLDLHEITWDSPASLLEKLMRYEAVHEIRSWDDLKNRLESDRQCFAFFHSKVPAEPLIFVEVALVNDLSRNIQELLDPAAETVSPDKADTAIFYSISNAQRGLSGINLGNFLIKQVVEKLRNKLKNLKHFATLSPMPGFRKWLDSRLLSGNEDLLSKNEIMGLRKITGNQNAARGLLQWLNSGWVKSVERAAALKPVLMRLGARYLLEEKRHQKALDPVANFHLSNGARIERLNWLANTSDKGLKESAGLMANYYYKLSDIEKNYEHYTTRCRVTASKEVKKWL